MVDQIKWGKVNTGSFPPAWDYLTDKEIEGEYTQMKVNVGPNKSNMYMIKTSKGEVGVWGTSLLNTQFPQIPIGNMVKLVYMGKATNPKTKRQYHNFELWTSKKKE